MLDNMIALHGRWIELWPGSSDKKWAFILETNKVGVFVRFSRIVIDPSFSGCSEEVNDVYFYPYKKLTFRFVSKEVATYNTVKEAYKTQEWSHNNPGEGFVRTK